MLGEVRAESERLENETREGRQCARRPLYWPSKRVASDFTSTERGSSDPCMGCTAVRFKAVCVSQTRVMISMNLGLHEVLAHESR